MFVQSLDAWIWIRWVEILPDLITYMSNTTGVFTKQERLTLCERMVSPPGFCWSPCCLSFYFFVLCNLICWSSFWALCAISCVSLAIVALLVFYNVYLMKCNGNSPLHNIPVVLLIYVIKSGKSLDSSSWAMIMFRNISSLVANPI
jgi:hypothetical protein